MQTLLKKSDPSGGWRLFVATFMVTTFVLLGVGGWQINKAYQNSQKSLAVLCESFVHSNPDVLPPVECKEYLGP